jgi:hypothetical protein
MRRVGRVIALVSVILAIALVTARGALVLRYLGPRSPGVRDLLVAGFVALGLGAVAARWRFELALLAHPDVREAAGIGVPDIRGQIPGPASKAV